MSRLNAQELMNQLVLKGFPYVRLIAIADGASLGLSALFARQQPARHDFRRHFHFHLHFDRSSTPRID